MEKYTVSTSPAQAYFSDMTVNDILTKSQRSKALERFNKHRRIGENHLTKHELETILVEIGKTPKEGELELMSETETIDQMYFYDVVNQYKVHCEDANGGLIENAFDSLKESQHGEIQIAKLKQTFLQDFGINISDFIGSNKHYLSLQDFKNMFS